MRGRMLTSLALALAGVFARTGISQAATSPDTKEVQIGAIAVILGVIVVLAVVYSIKHALGLDRQPPPQDDASAHAHH